MDIEMVEDTLGNAKHGSLVWRLRLNQDRSRAADHNWQRRCGTDRVGFADDQVISRQRVMSPAFPGSLTGDWVRTIGNTDYILGR